MAKSHGIAPDAKYGFNIQECAFEIFQPKPALSNGEKTQAIEEPAPSVN
jgi:hypothetical protein